MANASSTEGAKKVGVVSHYFGHIGVAAVKLTGKLRVGDTLKFVGATTDFEDTVKSLQIEHDAVSEAGPGEEVGIKIKDKVREGDRVYLI